MRRTGAALGPVDVARRIAQARESFCSASANDNPGSPRPPGVWAVAVRRAGAPEGGALVLEMAPTGEDGPLADATPADGGARRREKKPPPPRAGRRAAGPTTGCTPRSSAAALDAGWTLAGGDAAQAEMADPGRAPPRATPPRAPASASTRRCPEAGRAAMETAIVEGHCGLLPLEHVSAFIDAQRLRDARLADALLAADGPAVLIAGSGHVVPEGAPAYLAARAPTRAVLAIAFVEAPADIADPAALVPDFGTAQAPYDIAWFTADLPREDMCAQLRAQVRRRAVEKPRTVVKAATGLPSPLVGRGRGVGVVQNLLDGVAGLQQPLPPCFRAAALPADPHPPPSGAPSPTRGEGRRGGPTGGG